MKRIIVFCFVVSLFSGALYFYQYQFGSDVNVIEVDLREHPRWQEADIQSTLRAFLHSCDVFSKYPPNKNVGTDTFPIQALKWQKICHTAAGVNTQSFVDIRHFFEQNFKLAYFDKHGMVEGTFTGYYLPRLKGAWHSSKVFSYPIYEKPNDLISIDLGLFDKKLAHKTFFGRIKGQHIVPYHDRAAINKGVLTGQAKPLLWVNSRMDRFFLEIQGSGYVDMEGGSRVMVGYAGQNGRPYQSIGRYLVEQGAFSKEQASMQKIREFLSEHPEAIDKTLNHNASFIFFKELDSNLAIGAQGAYLTPGYSLAVDRHYIPLGVPILLDTTYPDPTSGQDKKFNRLVVAQDTGGAIKGRVRGDVFWGDLTNAAEIAGHMNQKGRYWLLLPK